MSKYNLLDNSSFECIDVNGNYENWSINKMDLFNVIIYCIDNIENVYSGSYLLCVSNVGSNIFFVSLNMELIVKDKFFIFSVMVCVVNVLNVCV